MPFEEQINITPISPSLLRRLESFTISTRRSFLGSGQGSHLSLRRGHGKEFAEFRAYTPGDDFRHIDWGVYGRTDRVMVREFRSEQRINILILIDGSQSMFFDGKLNYSSQLALALAAIAFKEGDVVTFSVLGGARSPKYSGIRSLPTATAFLQNSFTYASNSRSKYSASNFNLRQSLLEASQAERLPTRCFLISDLLYPLEELTTAIQSLRAKNFELSLIQVLSPSEVALDLQTSLSTAIDAETGEEFELALGPGSKEEYLELIRKHQQEIEHYTRVSGMLHIKVTSDAALENTLLTLLPQAGMIA